MRKTFSYFFVVLCLLGGITALSACSSDEYDDTGLKQQINGLDSRLVVLEQTINIINQEINQINILVEKIENSINIKSYVTIENGYRIIFTDGSSIDIKNGKDGKDGATPIIGVTLDIDGFYYWTVTINGTTTILLNGDGEKIRATGTDGITPIIKVDVNGYWIVSYDGGKHFTFILDNGGSKVPATGNQGGGSSTTIISNIYQENTYVVIKLYNGQVLRMPISNGFSISLAKKEIQLSDASKTATVKYTIKGSDSYTFVETVDKGNIKSKVIPTNSSSGTIQITRTGTVDSDTKVLVLLCNRDQTITTVLTVVSNVDPRLPEVVPPHILGPLEEHIPIYNGINPPRIEGSYRIDPMETVYCEDEGQGGFAPGKIVKSYDIRFFSQNTTKNTISYEGYTVDNSSHESSNGAFISGSGNYFTVFFNTVGQSQGISTKTALVISGEKTSTGIKDLHYAFVMVEKGSDPNNKLMKTGVFRVFKDKDGLAKAVTWSHTSTAASVARSIAPDSHEWGVFSFVK